MNEGETALAKLARLAQTIRSKNAGPDCITFDILFNDTAVYEQVKASGVFSRERIADIYGIETGRIVYLAAFDPALAIKFTLRRVRPSGSPGEPDVMGSQMYAPLLDIEVNVPAEVLARIVA